MVPFWLYPVFVKRWKTVTGGDEHSSSFASYDVGSSAFATFVRENYQYLLFDASIIKVRLSRNGVEAYFSANGYEEGHPQGCPSLLYYTSWRHKRYQDVVRSQFDFAGQYKQFEKFQVTDYFRAVTTTVLVPLAEPE